MKFTVSSSALLSLLATTGKVISSNNTLTLYTLHVKMTYKCCLKV